MRIFFTLIIASLAFPAFSQRFSTLNEGFVAQHWQNKMYYNPAATGYENKRIITVSGAYYGLLRDYDESTILYNGLVSYEQPFKANSRSSFGILSSYYNREFYIFNGKRFSGAASYSYALPLGKEKFLRFGAQAGFVSLNNNYLWGSPIVKIKGVAPIVNAGLYFNSKTLYCGVALKSLNEPKFQSTIKNSGGSWVDYKEQPELNIMAGNSFFADKTFQVKPSFLIISDFSASFIHVNNTVSYKNKYSLGASLLMERINTLAINAEIKAGEKFEFSANYEIPERGFTHSQGFEVSGRFLF